MFFLFFFLELFRFSLPVPKILVVSIRFLKKLIMWSFFHNDAMFQSDDLITVSNCGQSMSNHKRCWIFSNIIDSFLDFTFSFSVQCRCCFIKAHYFGCFQKSSCNGNSLLLTTWQLKTSFTYHFTIAFVFLLNELMKLCTSGSRKNSLF